MMLRPPSSPDASSVVLVDTNALSTYVRTKALTHNQGLALLAEALAILPSLASVEHRDAFDMATEFGISAYLGRFIAIAKHMNCRLVTEDVKLRAAVPAWTVALGDVK